MNGEACAKSFSSQNSIFPNSENVELSTEVKRPFAVPINEYGSSLQTSISTSHSHTGEISSLSLSIRNQFDNTPVGHRCDTPCIDHGRNTNITCESEKLPNNLTGNMLDLDAAIKLKNKHIHNPLFGFLNLNSLRNKINDIRSFINKLYPAMLTLCETKLDGSFPDSQFIVENYLNPGEYRKDRTKYGGGLMVYIKRGIHCRRLSKYEPSELEVICLEITTNKSKWAIISCYRPPNYKNLEIFFKEISKCLDSLTNDYDNILFLGDINVDTLNDRAVGAKMYQELCDIFGLTNLIKSNTCFTKTKSSSLDVILTNKPKCFFHSNTIETGISDVHTMISTMMRSHIKRLNPIKIHYRTYKYFNPCAFIDELERTNLTCSDSTNDPNDMFAHFSKKFGDGGHLNKF